MCPECILMLTCKRRYRDDVPHIRTHICEIQLMLEDMYKLKTNGCHENFVAARNILTQ